MAKKDEKQKAAAAKPDAKKPAEAPKAPAKPAPVVAAPKNPDELSGLSKIFNSQTTTGRANVAKAVYAFFGLLIVYKMIKPKQKI